MPQLKVKYSSARAIKKALDDIAGKISIDALEDLMEEAADFMRDKFDEAEYAGENPWDSGLEVYVEETGPMSRQLIAEGDTVEFIEYGTGIYTEGGREPYWFFKGNGRVIELNDYVEEADPVERTFRYETDERGRFREEGEWTDPKEDTYITRGNPPNHIVQQTEDFILESARDIFEETARKQS